MKRVVITGMGILSPIGNDVETFWNNLKNWVLHAIGKELNSPWMTICQLL